MPTKKTLLDLLQEAGTPLTAEQVATRLSDGTPISQIRVLLRTLVEERQVMRFEKSGCVATYAHPGVTGTNTQPPPPAPAPAPATGAEPCQSTLADDAAQALLKAARAAPPHARSTNFAYMPAIHELRLKGYPWQAVGGFLKDQGIKVGAVTMLPKHYNAWMKQQKSNGRGAQA